jgi:opacity protein-like surface antigen
MPYGFIGFAVGRANVTTGVTMSGTLRDCYTVASVPVCDPAVPIQPGSQSTTQDGKWVYGGAVGLGFDWALTQNIFVRGEWELVQLQDIEGIDARINTGRVALGVKF